MRRPPDAGSVVAERTGSRHPQEARMASIYVNTDNSNAASKIYKATRVGKSAAAAEKKMQDVVKALVGKAAGFTVSVAGKGYTIRIEVTKAETSGGTTTYTLHPEIVRFPSSPGKGGGGAEMVSTLTKDPTIAVQGNSESLLLDGIEMATENIVNKSLPLMKVDMTKR
jgi:hypothetical protein